MSDNQKPTLYYVPSSHWDREWYLPFQYFRHKLVRLMDEALECLQSGEYGGPFTGDGQSILIEDYLEIRPEKAAALEAAAREGRIVFGPWYVLPDEFLVSGESLIRNIRYGRELARAFGGQTSDAGFVCDLFGHNSQMPQILKGFGIRGGLVWRGVDARGGARIKWIGADGTELPTYRFGKSGYCDYTYKVRHSVDPKQVFDADKARAELKAFCQQELGRVGKGPGLIFDGGDHLFVDPEHYQLIKEFIENEELDFKVVHSTLDAFLDAFIAAGSYQRELHGELREPGRWGTTEDHQFLIPGVPSSRVWIKQDNAACESLLCQWLEPFAVMASKLLGMEYPQAYLTTAWKWLLQNHPHDSICGCSVDLVHEDMKFRFSQCQQIAGVCLDDTFKGLAAAVAGKLGERERRLCLYNPLPYARDEVVEFNVEIPADWPEFTEFFGYEPKPAFRLLDAAGEEIPYQRLATRRASLRKRTWHHKYPQVYPVHAVRVAARLQLPAMGQTVLKVVGQQRGEKEADHLGNFDVTVTRSPAAPGLRTGHARMENTLLAVEIQPNGGLHLTDKRTEQSYADLNLFESDADIGDGWNHGPTVNRHDVISGADRAQIELDADTPLLTRFIVRQQLQLPVEYDGKEHRRSDRRIGLLIESRITLRADAAGVDVETRIENTAGDHRLRAIFPTCCQADTYLADTPFDVVERPVALRKDNHLYRELEVDTKPQQSWTAISDADRGLAVVCAGGLLETAVIDRPDRAIALTLYRATRRTVMTDGEPEGQLFGIPLSFRYQLIPFSGEADRPALFRQAQALSGGLRSVHLDAIDIKEIQRLHKQLALPEIPAVAGLLQLQGEAVLTSLRQVNGGIEIRLFNPQERTVEAGLHLSEKISFTKARLVDFESNPISSDAINVQGSLITVSLPAKAIRTVTLTQPGEADTKR